LNLWNIYKFVSCSFQEPDSETSSQEVESLEYL